MNNILSLSVLFLLGASVQAQTATKNFLLPEATFSPNHLYGVTVPILKDPDQRDGPKNTLIEIKSGRTLAVIEAVTGWDHMNHQSVLPSRWSSDGSLLLWEVDGKWSPDALVLLKIEKGQLAWQSNILKEAQQALLTRTREALPKKYAEAKKANAGSGSAYPEGFTIDVEAIGPVALPLRVRAALTSNPKGIEDAITVESHLEGLVDAQGKFTVKEFKLGPGHSNHF